MITNPTLYRRGQRLLVAALLLSLFFHAAGFAVWGFIFGFPRWLNPRPQTEPIVVLSSATTIRHEAVPAPPQPAQHGNENAHPAPPHLAQRAAQPQQQEQPQRAITPAQATERELAYTAPSAPPQPVAHRASRPRPATPQQRFSQRLAQEQQAFAREVAELRARNNPMSVATIAPRPPSAYRRAYLNISGVDRNLDRYEGLVTPIQTWIEDGLRCHYVTYDVEYTSGASDRGNIPWPLCYPPSQDPMVLPDGRPVPNGSPVPVIDLFPMQGYVLPQGTYLTQFLRQLYNRQL